MIAWLSQPRGAGSEKRDGFELLHGRMVYSASLGWVRHVDSRPYSLWGSQSVMTASQFAKRLSVLFVATALSVASGLAQDAEPFPLYNLRPYLQSLTSTSVLIVSQSKDKAVAKLEYGLTDKLGTKLIEAEPANDHLFKLEGLEPNTRYFYRVTHIDVTTYPKRSFRTLPDPGGELSLVVIGDSGTASEEQIGISDLMLGYSPQLFLHTGDMVYPYGAPSYYYQKFFKIYPELLAGTCIYPTLGNHDCFVSPDYWLTAFHLPANNPSEDESYYSFDAGDAHFVCLNSCEEDVPRDQLDWLDVDLEATNRKWKIVYFHHPPYSDAIHNGVDVVRAQVVPVFEKHHVDLVLCGHDHVYERTYPVFRSEIRSGYQNPDFVSPGGTIYVVSGGGGAGLYDFIGSPELYLNAFFESVHHFLSIRITPDRIECMAIDTKGQAIDGFSIRKDGEARPFRFIRGDVDEDSTVNLTDAVTILNVLFTGADPHCKAACDVDGSQSVSITDAVLLLSFLFQGGPAPAAPFPECGAAVDAETTGCRRACN